MIGDSIFEVILIRFSVLALRAVTPLSFLTLPLLVIRPRRVFGTNTSISWITTIATCWTLSECLFFLGVYLPHKYGLKKIVLEAPHLQKAERETLMTRCLGAIDEPESFIRGWFCGAPLDLIRRENLREWLAWVFLSSESAEGEDLIAWNLESEHYILEMERIFGWTIPPGKTEGLKFMTHNIDPVNTVHRPLVWYMVVGVIDVVTHISLSLSGLQYYSTSRWFQTFPPRPQTLFSQRRSPRNEVSYWYRPHLSSTKKPIVLIHGMGIGLFAYVSLIRSIILSDKNVGMIVVEVLPISMRILPLKRPDWKPQTFCDSLYDILRAHDIDQFTLVGHSYGTFLSAHILREPNLEPRVSSIVLIDPIPFLLFHPFLVSNVVYRVPGPCRANEWMIWYFTSRDISAAVLLQRHFFWSSGVLWRDDNVFKNRRTLVLLAAQDQLVSSPQVWKYLTGVPMSEYDSGDEEASREVIEWKDGNFKAVLNIKLDHAQILMHPSKYSAIIDHINHPSSP